MTSAGAENSPLTVPVETLSESSGTFAPDETLRADASLPMRMSVLESSCPSKPGSSLLQLIG